MALRDQFNDDPHNPYAMPSVDERGVPYALVFDTQEEYLAWRERYPEYAAALEAPDLPDPQAESKRQWAEWRAAGNAGPPPGYVSAREYFRARRERDV